MHLNIHLQIKYISFLDINSGSTLRSCFTTTNRRDVEKMGKNICRILKTKDVGSIGIGAMIVFIAMVLVAGIAASVLIQTSTTLESQALTTGKETTAEVSSGLDVVNIEGYKSGAGTIDMLAIAVRPRAGSADIDLAQTVIEISDSSIISIPIKNATEDVNYFYDVDAIDEDNDVLYYFLIKKPEGMIINQLTGLINWTPKENQVGIHQIIVEVSDGDLTDRQEFEINVLNINYSPIITSTPGRAIFCTDTP